MLNADADSEGFCFHGDLIFAEFKEGIACRVADRKDCRLRGNLLGFIDGYRSESAVFNPKVRHFCSETDFSAPCLDLFPHRCHNSDELIGAKVWFLIVQNFFRCPAFRENPEYLTVSAGWILHRSV